MYITTLRTNVINTNIKEMLLLHYRVDNIQKYEIIFKRLNTVFNLDNIKINTLIDDLNNKKDTALVGLLKYVPVRIFIRSHKDKHYIQTKRHEYEIDNTTYKKIMEDKFTITNNVVNSYSLIYKEDRTYRVSDYTEVLTPAHNLRLVVPVKDLLELDIIEEHYSYTFVSLPEPLESLEYHVKHKSFILSTTYEVDDWLDIDNFKHIILYDIDKTRSPFFKKFLYDLSLFMEANNITKEDIKNNTIDDVSLYNLFTYIQNYTTREWTDILQYVRDGSIDVKELNNNNKVKIYKALLFYIDSRLIKDYAIEQEKYYKDINYLLKQINT